MCSISQGGSTTEGRVPGLRNYNLLYLHVALLKLGIQAATLPLALALICHLDSRPLGLATILVGLFVFAAHLKTEEINLRRIVMKET